MPALPAVPSPADIAQRIQRDAGRMALRARNGVKYAAGIDRPKVGLTPKDTVWKDGKVELWRYRNDRIGYRPPLLIVHSLVSKSYVLDLYPGNSFIERFLAAGFDIFLLDWGVPDAEDADNTLETYIDGYMHDAFEATLRVSGRDETSLLGYCFGGVLTLLFGARYPDLPMRNLLTMATPVDISKVGLPSLLFAEGRLEPEMIIDETGNVPPEVIYDGIKLLKPTADVVQYARLWQFLWNDEYVDGLQAMGQWTRDHIPFPGSTFRQCVDMLFRDNGLMTDRLRLGGQPVHLRDITCPFLALIAERDYVVPLEAADPITSLVGSKEADELRLDAGHIGFVAGRQAAKENIPKIIDWLGRHSDRLAREEST
jgi:polyhydroxyalkanoate synthase